MISRERMEKALIYLAETDHDLAAAKEESERLTWICKHTRAVEYEMADGKSVEDRKQAVERSQKVSEAEMKRIKAFGALEYLKAKRESEELVIAVWRTLEASRRKETIT